MKQGLLIGAILLIGFLHLTSQNTQTSNSEIFWCEHHKLKWSDFQGEPDKHKHHALTSYEIKFNISIKGTRSKFEVSCYFTKNKSWVKSGKETSKLLEHEQLHFDIAEIYARKLRKELQETQMTLENLEEIANEIYLKNLDDLNQMQMAYDRDTKHSMHKINQKKWAQKVASLMIELEPFKDETFCKKNIIDISSK